ncbi:Conserved oligomeric Golgi complex subunit 7 [Plasmodiophora brassicae]|uniref:Conserved oligomeric Golgi complex subunit 7 n=1 Tax=Plasmodiophora brassicae TaxID=37360 RepID=A0A3P3Y1Z8_PLABS|nr:unnamed protein product [Plasmodiophora brassicae]
MPSGRAAVNDLLTASVEEAGGKISEELVATLVSKAQVEGKRLASKVALYKTQLHERLPEALDEVERASMSAATLQKRLDTLIAQLSMVDERTEASVAALARVDSVKLRIERCAKLVTEIQTWKYRLKSVNLLFDSKEIDKIAEEIEEMQKSLVLLEKLPEFDSRQAELNDLRSRLEAMCSPHLLVAIQKNDAEALAQYTAIFTRIGVADTIAQLYFSSLTDWLSEASASCNPAQLSEWLASFLVTVSDKITAECNTLPERFPSISQSDLVLHVLKALRRKLDQWVRTMCSTSGSTPVLDLLLEVLEASKTFVISFAERPHLSPSEVNGVINAIASVFTPYASRYGELEKQKLSTQLASCYERIVCDAGCTAMLDAMDWSLSHLGDMCDGALARCVAFASGATAQSLAGALDFAMSEYIQHILSMLRRVRRLAGFDGSVVAESDWSSIATAFRFLRFARRLRHQLRVFDVQCLTTLSQSLSRLLATSSAEGDSPATIFGRAFVPHQPAQIGYLSAVIDRIHDPSHAATDTRFLDRSVHSCQSLERAMRTLVYDSMQREVHVQLHGLPTWDVWGKDDVSSTDDDLPVFSSQPSDYITKIGEHLFGLIQPLEVQISLNQQEDHVEDNVDDGLLAWLQRASTGTAEDLLQSVQEINFLGTAGARQLSADLEYISNIISALGIAVPPSLSLVQQALAGPPHRQSQTPGLSQSDRELLGRISAIRQRPAVQPEPSTGSST